MAKFRDRRYLQPDSDTVFDDLHDPAAMAPYSGIYRFEGCGLEILTYARKSLPDDTHHPHAQKSIPILWRLLVRAMDSGL